MKKIGVALALVLAVVFSANAQNDCKLGHVNTDEIVQALPDWKVAQKAIEELQKNMEEEMKTRTEAINERYNSYVAGRPNLSKEQLQQMENEIIELEKKLNDYRRAAQQELQEKEEELINPIITKVNDAIKKIATEGGYTYIFNAGAGALAFDGGEDVSPKVKKALGLE